MSTPLIVAAYCAFTGTLIALLFTGTIGRWANRFAGVSDEELQ